jgi:hypothetical protein
VEIHVTIKNPVPSSGQIFLFLPPWDETSTLTNDMQFVYPISSLAFANVENMNATFVINRFAQRNGLSITLSSILAADFTSGTMKFSMTPMRNPISTETVVSSKNPTRFQTGFTIET